ncbi:MAG: hypothetical protein IJN43_07615 [Ruminococcus sp.]|nr:hypothetical protein [Ruminococcus sp.]
MKKSLSLLSAAVLTASCLSITTASADVEATPLFYMKAAESGNYEINGEMNVIKIDSLETEMTISAKIYFSDDSKGAWSISPKWNSNSEHIKITNVYNPLEDGNLKEFAYAEKDADGNLIVSRNGCDYSVNKNYGSHNFTVRSADGKALVPYGEWSDSYPLLTFDFTIDADTPDGTYEIFFTKDEDNATRCAMDAANGNTIYTFPDNPPSLSNLTIIIGEDAQAGDISLQGKPVEAAPGEKVEVDFVINAPENTKSGISGVFFKVDSGEKLNFVSAEFDDAFNFYGMYNAETGEVAFANPDGKDVPASNGDTLVTLTFEVPADAAKGDVYKIGLNGLEIVNTNGVNVTSNAAIQPVEIKVTDSLTPNYGDINLDGVVDASDASMALVEYASMSTGDGTTLNAQQALNGDGNFDGTVNSSDASDILSYYAHVQTSGDDAKTFLDFFNRKAPV